LADAPPVPEMAALKSAILSSPGLTLSLAIGDHVAGLSAVPG
jgi:hypothetical protein